MPSSEVIWVSIGFFGQSLFFSRWLLQWFVSERKAESSIPLPFWYMSLGGKSHCSDLCTLSSGSRLYCRPKCWSGGLPEKSHAHLPRPKTSAEWLTPHLLESSPDKIFVGFPRHGPIGTGGVAPPFGSWGAGPHRS